MIPVIEVDKPQNFEKMVEIPGQNFLEKFPNPTKDDWKKKGNKIYQRASDWLYEDYKKVCAYSAEHIPVKEKSIDHFVSKSQDKTLAFKWSNYRLCFDVLNENKSSNTILDPFRVEINWFVIDFVINIVKPNEALEDAALKKEIQDTIDILKLNEQLFSDRRTSHIHAYYKGTPATIKGLRKRAPFISYELERQNLVEGIKVIHEKFLIDSGRHEEINNA